MNRGLLRLLHLRDEAEAVAVEMIDERVRFAKLRKSGQTRAVAAFNLFQTPEDIAARMVEMLPALPDDAQILEPSAGLGRLYRAIRLAGYAQDITLIESSSDCCGELYRATDGDHRAHLLNRDFLDYSPAAKFDAVVMNPPFKRGRDIKHIKHAAGMLKRGGVLVALCYSGSAQAKHLQPIADTWELLGAGLFEGTGAGVVLMTICR